MLNVLQFIRSEGLTHAQSHHGSSITLKQPLLLLKEMYFKLSMYVHVLYVCAHVHVNVLVRMFVCCYRSVAVCSQ